MAQKALTRGAGRRSSALCHASAQPPPDDARAAAGDNFSRQAGSKRVGALFETHAQRYLERAGLASVARNVTVRGGEIDLVMRDGDGTLVFIEVRARASGRFGGAAASVVARKRRRIVYAAQLIWARLGGSSACRFDVVAFESGRLVWIRDAFRADDV